MRLAQGMLVAWLLSAAGCESGEKQAPKPAELTPGDQQEVQKLEARVRELETEREGLHAQMPSVRKLEEMQLQLEQRKNRLEALSQRDKVIPCLVTALTRALEEGTSIAIVEIVAEGIAIELPITDGSKFEPTFNGCGAVGTSKKIAGGWGFFAKLDPLETPPSRPSAGDGRPEAPPAVSVLAQLPGEPKQRLEALRSVAEELAKENVDLREKKQGLDRLAEQRDELMAAEQSLRTPPDVPTLVDEVQSAATSCGIELTSTRPETGNQIIRVHLELKGKLLDLGAMLVKLQERPGMLVAESLVLKPGDGRDAVPMRMTLASPRL